MKLFILDEINKQWNKLIMGDETSIDNQNG